MITPLDLHNVIAQVTAPHVEGKSMCVPCKEVPKKSGVEWKGLYAGRRGACTAVVEATRGNYAVAQALLRRKSMKTTLDVYKPRITLPAFKDGMRRLEEAANQFDLTYHRGGAAQFVNRRIIGGASALCDIGPGDELQPRPAT